MEDVLQKYLRRLMIPILVFHYGCGGGDQPLQSSDAKQVPVSGRVLMGRQPVPGAIVTLEPKFEWKPDVPKPRAVTEADGSFEIGTKLTGDGAPAGTYQVSIGSPEGESKIRIAAKFEDPASSGLTATVADKPVRLPDFLVKPEAAGK